MSEANLRSGYALRLDGITRRFRSGEETLEILSGADFDLVAGEIVALVAPSGTGKSTLLHLAGLLEAPSEGAVYIGDRAASGLGQAARTAMRRDEIGFVYQFHHLLVNLLRVKTSCFRSLLQGCPVRTRA